MCGCLSAKSHKARSARVLEARYTKKLSSGLANASSRVTGLQSTNNAMHGIISRRQGDKDVPSSAIILRPVEFSAFRTVAMLLTTPNFRIPAFSACRIMLRVPSIAAWKKDICVGSLIRPKLDLTFNISSAGALPARGDAAWITAPTPSISQVQLAFACHSRLHIYSPLRASVKSPAIRSSRATTSYCFPYEAYPSWVWATFLARAVLNVQMSKSSYAGNEWIACPRTG